MHMDYANMWHGVVLIRFVHHLMLSLEVLKARNIQEMLADSSSAVTMF